jgi:hypothetical protein
MSKRRASTSTSRAGLVRNVAQHAKLPPLKRPNGKALTQLLDDISKVLEIFYEGRNFPHLGEALLDYMNRLDKTSAPFRRYEDKK